MIPIHHDAPIHFQFEQGSLVKISPIADMFWVWSVVNRFKDKSSPICKEYGVSGIITMRIQHKSITLSCDTNRPVVESELLPIIENIKEALAL